MTDYKALALTLDGFADHLEQGGTRCENGPKDIAVFREAARILRDVVPELEAHLESLQNRYALVTAENDTLRGFQDCRDDKGDFLYEQWKDRQLEKD